jgi:hypothetical protein
MPRPAMSILNVTPEHRLCDPQGRPYFLWDMDLTLVDFRRQLATGSRTVRSWLIGKLMRQAKPDDVLQFVTRSQIQDLWPDLVRYLGKTREFWAWLMNGWGYRVHA